MAVGGQGIENVTLMHQNKTDGIAMPKVIGIEATEQTRRVQ
jgi:hypothetical protein